MTNRMAANHPLAGPLLNELLQKLGQPSLSPDAESACAICSETYLSGEVPEFPVTLPCKHTMGSVCLMKWLSPLSAEGHNHCPYCRAPVFKEWHARDFNAEKTLPDNVRRLHRRRPAARIPRRRNANDAPGPVPRRHRAPEMLPYYPPDGASPRFIQVRERVNNMAEGRVLFGPYQYPPPNPFRRNATREPSNDAPTEGPSPPELHEHRRTTYQPYNLQHQTRNNTYRPGTPPGPARRNRPDNVYDDSTDDDLPNLSPQPGDSLRDRMLARAVVGGRLRSSTNPFAADEDNDRLRPAYKPGHGAGRQRRPRWWEE